MGSLAIGGRGRSQAAIDAAVLLAVACAAGCGAVAMTDGLVSVTYDSFRDMAWTHNILAGRVWSDPVLLGEPWWYAPGSPLLCAALARVTGAPVVDVHRSSALWWNGFIPVLLYLAVRAATDRLTGLLALPLVWLGSLWWLTHLAAPMPSIQGVALGLASLLLWQRGMATAADAPAAGAGWGAATGVGLAATAWVHPVCALHAAGAIAVHGLAATIWPRAAGVGRRFGPLARLVVAGGVALLMALPLIGHLLTLARRNPVPLSYFARELGNPDFALQIHAPLVPALAVLGVVAVARSVPGLWWVVGYLGVAAVGQSSGYLRHSFGIDVPCILPHEFQWHGQLALGICAAVSVVRLGQWLARRLPWPREPGLAHLLWIGGFMTAALAPALPYLEVADAYLADVTAVAASRQEVVEWLATSTPIDAVVACEPQVCHLAVAGLTGRKCVAGPIGHSNPSVDGRGRLEELRRMLATEDETEFLALARRRGVVYLLLDAGSPEGARRLALRRQWRSVEPAFEAQRQPTLVFRIVPEEAPGGTT